MRFRRVKMENKQMEQNKEELKNVAKELSQEEMENVNGGFFDEGICED